MRTECSHGAGIILQRGCGHRISPMKTERAQRGASMIEFAVVGPVITLIGLAILQYAMMFNAKNMMNHASFMAARAGSMGNARIGTVRDAYIKALIPMYGGGRSEAELAQAYARAVADTSANMRVEILNPTRESYDAYNSSALHSKYGARAIPNSGLAFKNSAAIDPVAGQNIQDANILKIRITHGYLPKVPLMGEVYKRFLQRLDTGSDAFQTGLVNAGRIPVTTEMTVQMQTDPVEGPTVSVPGQGSVDAPGDTNGNPADQPTLPDCGTTSCATPSVPPTIPGGGQQPNPGGNMCPANAVTTSSSVPADVLFEFGSASLTAEGKAMLDDATAAAKADGNIASVTLTGYTDQLGSASLNTTLSLNRAIAVRDYLQANGFPRVPIAVQGGGSANPKVQLTDCPASGQAQKNCLAPNRRVDITITRSAS